MVPSDKRLPDVVVAQIGMLVVGRIEVGDVGREGFRSVGGVELVGRAIEMLWVGEEIGDAELDVLVGAWRPGFEVGHLHAGGRIHPVGRFDQAREDDGFEFGFELEGLDVLAHRVDASPVVGVEEPGIEAVGLGNEPGVPIACSDGVELVDDPGRLVDESGRVGLDVAHREIVGVGVVIVGVDTEPGGFEGVSDPGCAAEEVDDRAPGRCSSTAERDDLIDEETL